MIRVQGWSIGEPVQDLLLEISPLLTDQGSDVQDEKPRSRFMIQKNAGCLGI